MDVSPIALSRVILSEVPSLIKTFFSALLHLSPTSPLQDVTTQLVVATVRPILGTPAGLKMSQRQTTRDLPIRGGMWVSKVVLPRPQDEDLRLGRVGGNAPPGSIGVKEAIEEVFRVLGDGTEELDMPEVRDVEAEWNAYRSGVGWFAKRPAGVGEEGMYERMMKDVKEQQQATGNGNEGPTILYFHGGAFCLMDPSTHRYFTSGLAHRTHGRCLSVRFRLAPQHPFPASLVDGLVAYLSLLSPPPGSFHTAVPASRIVFAGDSSGAALAVSLTLLLLTLSTHPSLQHYTHLRFHSRLIPLRDPNQPILPAGLSLLHPYIDITRSLPSVHRNAPYDIITPPSPEYPAPLFPADSIWPASPHRVETYTTATAVIHPLVSPIAASTDSLRGFPPTYLTVGYEGLQDEISVFARRLFHAGSYVDFDGYKGMPHCFAFLMPWSWAGRRCFRRWAQGCLTALALSSSSTSSSSSSSSFSSLTTSSSFTTTSNQKIISDNNIGRPTHATWTDRFNHTTAIPFPDLAADVSSSFTPHSKNNNNKPPATDETIIHLDDDTVQSLLRSQRDLRVKLEDEGREKWYRLVMLEQRKRGRLWTWK